MFRENNTPARRDVSLSFDFRRKSDAAPSWLLKQPQGQCGEGGLQRALWWSCVKRTMASHDEPYGRDLRERQSAMKSVVSKGMV